MAELLKGVPVAEAINKRTIEGVNKLKSQGITPTLAILRVGNSDSDIAYEKSAMKRCDLVGVEVKNVLLPSDVEAEEFYEVLEELNKDENVHGILMLRPLPSQIDSEKARKMMLPEKDIDGCTDGSMAGVYTNTKLGFEPCTARAVMEILRFYGIDPCGKKAVVIGRSLVIGRPVSLMLLHANATPTICHTKTADITSVAKSADILILASGQMESIGTEYVNPSQIVIDVGVAWNEAKQKLCGDARFEELESVVAGITPIAGGVGTVTTSIMVNHVVEAAMRINSI